MNWWLNSIFDFLFGQRLEEINKSLDVLTQRVNYLYTITFNEEEDGEEEDYLENDKECLINDSFYFGVFVRPRLNNHTQLQFVSGTTDTYNTKKLLYTDMTPVVELLIDGGEKENEVSAKKITARLEAAGFNVTHISENSKIIKGHIDDVVDVITQ